MRKYEIFLAAGLWVALTCAAGLSHAEEWLSKGSLAEGGHTHYIPNVSNPFVNETPYITSEARLLFIHNDVPNTAIPVGGVGGGHINVTALQLRVALSQRFGFFLNKFAYMDFNHRNSPVTSDDGLSNITLGAKYAFISDPRQGIHVTAGMAYEMPAGTLKADMYRMAGDGSGYLNGFVTAAESYNKVGVQAMMNFRFGLDGERSSSWFNYALHMDYEVMRNVFPLVEFNGFIPVIEDARQNSFDYDGLDLVTLGGNNPHSVITFAIGSRYRFSKNVLAGLAYEVPLTEHKDIMDWRVTADLVLVY